MPKQKALDAAVARSRKRIGSSVLDTVLPKEEVASKIQVDTTRQPGMYEGITGTPFTTVKDSSDLSVTQALLRARGMPSTDMQGVQYDENANPVNNMGRPFSVMDRPNDRQREATIAAMRSWGVKNPEEQFMKSMMDNAAYGHGDYQARSPVDVARGSYPAITNTIEAATNLVKSPEEILKARLRENKAIEKYLKAEKKRGS